MSRLSLSQNYEMNKFKIMKDEQIECQEYNQFLLNIQYSYTDTIGKKNFGDFLDIIKKEVIYSDINDFIRNNVHFKKIKTINDTDVYHRYNCKFMGVDVHLFAFVIDDKILKFSISLPFVTSFSIFHMLNALKGRYGDPSNCFNIPDMEDIKRDMLINESNIVAFNENAVYIQFGTTDGIKYASINFDTYEYQICFDRNKECLYN